MAREYWYGNPYHITAFRTILNAGQTNSLVASPVEHEVKRGAVKVTVQNLSKFEGTSYTERLRVAFSSGALADGGAYYVIPSGEERDFWVVDNNSLFLVTDVNTNAVAFQVAEHLGGPNTAQ